MSSFSIIFIQENDPHGFKQSFGEGGRLVWVKQAFDLFYFLL